MARRLPPLNALRAFEAAARHLSLTKAASELHVTTGAISHQVKSLEARLGAKLFKRGAHGLEFTDLGREYLPVLREAFDRIAGGTDSLFSRRESGTLTVSVSPNFAAKWLLHRLGRFNTAHPQIDLRIAASIEHVDFAQGDVDVAVRHGDGRWPGLAVTRLAGESVFPVCSPRLRAGGRRLRSAKDLKDHVLLHGPGPLEWKGWLDAAGVTGIDTRRGTRFSDASLAIEAAVDALGVALARSALAAQDLIGGRLVQPFGPALPAAFAYYIVCPVAMASRASVAAFRAWLLGEAAEDARKLARLGIRV
jgi:LysR family glycine cleavage system transcriptional activator